MTDRETDPRTNFRDRLIAVDIPSPESRQQLEKELHTMFVRQLTTPRRITFAIVAVVSLASAAVCATLSMTEPTLPPTARAGLGTGALFGLAWFAVAVRLAWRGTLDIQLDGRRIAAMVWVFTVLMMVFFLIVGMTSEDRLLGLLMISQGLAFLIGAAVYFLSYRIEQSELATREKLLQLELRLAELAEQRS